MNFLKNNAWKIYRVVALFLLSVIITAILANHASHPGVALGMSAIVVGLMLVYRAITAHKASIFVHTVLLVILELLAICIIAFGNDPVEIWFTTMFTIFSITLSAERMFVRVKHQE